MKYCKQILSYILVIAIVSSSLSYGIYCNRKQAKAEATTDLTKKIEYTGVTSKKKAAENTLKREMPDNPNRPSSRRDEWSGDYVYFGNWKKYSETKAIKWKVLKNDGKELLLMTDESVDSRPYRAHDDYASDADYTDERENTWEKSSIRKWLNNEFYKTAFTEEEQAYLVTNTVLNGYSSDDEYDSGPTTYDKVYLLSTQELSKSSYGFYGRGGIAVSRQFIETKETGSYYSEIWTRTMASVTMTQGVGNPYAYWISKKGEFIRRGAFMTSAASWDKNVHPVIEIPIDCPYWSNEDPADDEFDNGVDGGKFSLKGLDFNLTVPDNIPAIGGMDMNMDFGSLPIEFDMKKTEHGSEFRAAIGLKIEGGKKPDKDNPEEKLWDLEFDQWNGVKKWAESKDENFLKGNLALKDVKDKVSSRIQEGKSAIGGVGSPLSKKINISVSGFAEGTIDNGNVRSLGGGVWVKMSYKMGRKWQCWILHLPVVVKFELGLGFDEKLSVGVDIGAAEFYNKGDIEIELPSVKVSGGVGIAYIADVSMYGSAKNVINVKAGTSGSSDRENLTATISGEIGVSASALCFSVEKNLFDLFGIDARWEYWNEKKGGLQLSKKALKGLPLAQVKNPLKFPANTYCLNRADFAKQSPWYTETTTKISKRKKGVSTQGNSSVLQSGIYSAPGVRMATTDDGTTMMVYVADIEGRTAGNHTAVVYSVYDNASQTWSVPQILEDDGTADFYPDIIADGSDIYVAWTDSKRKDFLENVSLSDMAASCEITVAKYNAESAGFSVNSLTSNASVDIKPILGKVNNQVGLIWLNNSENDILEFSGTNSLQYAICNQGQWSGAVSYISCKDKIINSYSIGTVKDENYIAYITEAESEQNKAELFVGKLGEKPSIFDTTIDPEQGVQFATINGLNLLTWYGDGTLAYSTNLKNDYSLFQNELFSSEYQIVTSGKTSVLLFRASDQTLEENGTEVFMCLSENGSFFSQPVKVTNEGKNIGSYTLSIKNGEYNLVYSRDDVTLQENSIDKQTDLCQKIIAPYHSLSLEKVNYRESEIKPGGELSLYTVIKNNGLADEKKFHAFVKCGEQILYDKDVSCNVEMGSDADATIKITLPNNISKGNTIQVVINPIGAENTINGENHWEINIGKSDLALNVEMDDENKEVVIKTKNNSAVSTNAILRVRDTDENGEIIKELDLGEILGNGELETKVSYSEILGGKVGMPVYFEVIGDGEEMFQSNNFSYRFLEKDSNAALPSDGSQLGDVYQDGKIDGKDVSLLLQYRLKKRELTEEQIVAGDVYQDGKIDGKDVSKLLQYRLGKIESLE